MQPKNSRTNDLCASSRLCDFVVKVQLSPWNSGAVEHAEDSHEGAKAQSMQPKNSRYFAILFSFLCIFLFSHYSSFAQSIPERPSPQRLVNNISTEFPDFLNAQEERALEEKLENFSNETSNQICIVITDSLWGYSAADFTERIITTWGVGKKDKNNGVVIMIKPTGGAGGRDAFIGTGYGLEGAIPDLTCKKIVDNELLPNLKQGDPYKALDAATSVLMALAKGEYNSKDYSRKVSGDGKLPWRYVIIGIVILIMISRFFRRSGFTSYTGRGRHFGGGWGGGFGGGGWGGGSSGGWGGFGGGSGGGGGAGGKW